MTSPRLNASARIMNETALEMGIECTAFPDREMIFMKKGERSWYTRGSRTSLQSSVGKTIADQKHITKMVLEYHHLPTARGVKVGKDADLVKLEQLQFPLVMKPLDERHGKGVIVGIETPTQAAEQFASQQSSSSRSTVIFEETLQGTEYRIVCVNFQFVAAAFRRPAHVVGDGKHTITELIAVKNAHPWRGEGHENNLSLIKVDELVTEYLQQQGFTPSSVPPQGQEVMLRKTANLSTGGEAWDVTAEVCAENRALFEKIAHVCDLNTIGIDIMCASLKTPIVDQPHAGVIEVNASPGLRMHHYPIQGKPVNVAQKILEMVLAHE